MAAHTSRWCRRKQNALPASEQLRTSSAEQKQNWWVSKGRNLTFQSAGHFIGPAKNDFTPSLPNGGTLKAIVVVIWFQSTADNHRHAGQNMLW